MSFRRISMCIFYQYKDFVPPLPRLCAMCHLLNINIGSDMQSNLKSILILTGAMTFSLQAFAFGYDYPKIYPFVPVKVSKIYSDVKKVSEDKWFIRNFKQILKKGLSKSQTKSKPWTSSYWPLSKGTIADPYEDSKVGYYVTTSWINWESNYDSFQDRKREVLAHIDSLSDQELEKLAPSEKYDLLLGDRSFDLTNRLFDYMKRWGSKKEHGFLLGQPDLIGEDALKIARGEILNEKWHRNMNHAFKNSYRLQGSLAVEYANKLVAKGKYSSVVSAFPEALSLARAEAGNYVLERKNERLAAWEGICNGWSTAAGLVPRPRKSVVFVLPDGRKLKFFPSDIKGLISLFWVNSLIQDNANKNSKGKVTYGGTIGAGLRCNLKYAATDEWGRLYDDEADPFSGTLDPRCVGVHPATWHLGLVNIIGKQKRSFIVERKVDAAVDNHPMHKYKMDYFNPNDGEYHFSASEMNKNIVRINSNDQFKDFRNPRAKYIVGVRTTMTYLDYRKPRRKETDSEKDDEDVDVEMLYDLELDANYNIVGGQWRAVESGTLDAANEGDDINDGNYNQPDFFWVVTKQWKKTGLFKNEKGLASWRNGRMAPPRSWIKKAKESHSFTYNNTYKFYTGQKCRMQNTETGEWRKVSCEMKYNKPQPLINVLNVLISRSK